MSYEEEQRQLSEEYKQLKMKCDILSEYFKNNPQILVMRYYLLYYSYIFDI